MPQVFETNLKTDISGYVLIYLLCASNGTSKKTDIRRRVHWWPYPRFSSWKAIRLVRSTVQTDHWLRLVKATTLFETREVNRTPLWAWICSCKSLRAERRRSNLVQEKDKGRSTRTNFTHPFQANSKPRRFQYSPHLDQELSNFLFSRLLNWHWAIVPGR